MQKSNPNYNISNLNELFDRSIWIDDEFKKVIIQNDNFNNFLILKNIHEDICKKLKKLDEKERELFFCEIKAKIKKTFNYDYNTNYILSPSLSWEE